MADRPPVLFVVSCEHAGHRVPPAYRPLFRGARATLESHRGWDPGAREVAVELARRLGVVPILHDVTRLLIEVNRSIGHVALFSEFTRDLDVDVRDRLREAFYEPHRREVAAAIERGIARAGQVVHLGVHSFTPEWNGQPRNAELGLLYDPKRTRERRWCEQWQRRVRDREPSLCVRRNYPYRGAADGLTTALRRTYAPARYLGLEIEINQRTIRGTRAARGTSARSPHHWAELLAETIPGTARRR
ncbi:MAG: N-formylglutamate amidohydrolase [Planctomycetes bacterium]|nr:N-formylglutamate amidohydrolase [Planctomycetota bacterium]